MFFFGKICVFQKYFKRKKTLYILLQWKKYDPCMDRWFLKVSGLNCSFREARLVNMYFIWFVFKLIVAQMYLSYLTSIVYPDCMYSNFLPCHLWCHFVLWYRLNLWNYHNKDCLETFEVKKFAWWVYVYLSMMCFKSILRGRELYIFCYNETSTIHVWKEDVWKYQD